MLTIVDQPPEPMTIHVELDVFSGRPNPTWVVEDEQARELVAALSALPTTSAPSATPDGLGYRCFRLVGVPSMGVVTAGYGSITVTNGASVAHRLDPQRTVEAMLLRSAQGRVDEALLRTITPLVLP
jgi:hypothetical protein